MILVTGATGTISSQVARLLDERGVPHRGMSRKPAQGFAQADFTNPESLAAALAGVDAVFLVTVPPTPSPAHDIALVEAAKAAGVTKIVKLSAIGTGDVQDGRVVGEWHLAAEEAIAASGLAWTILRPPSFASNFLWYRPLIADGTPIPNMLGEARQPIVDPRDVAAVAVEALTTTAHDGQRYEVTGPSLLTFATQAATLGKVLNREVRTVAVDPAEQLRAAGTPPEAIPAITVGISWAAAGRAQVTDVVERVLGRPAGTFEEWARDHREAFNAMP
jgi:uncharacterized protein YbjT (DUF2867 family)